MRSFVRTWRSAGATALAGHVRRMAGIAVLSAAALAAVACTETHAPLTFAKIEIDGGNFQSAKICTRLPAPLVVSAWDQFGNPLPGALIRFAAEEGSFSSESALAGADGRASVEYTLGATPGPVQVQALAWRDEYRLDFDLTAEPDPPTHISRVSGHNQSAVVGSALANPLVARVADACGEGIAGVIVDWSATGGVLGSAQSVTDEDGIANNTFTVSAEPGQTTITATAGDAGSVTFTATATAPPAED